MRRLFTLVVCVLVLMVASCSNDAAITGSNINQSDYIISFLDNDVKTRCVVNWDTDGDKELSKAEAAKVTSLGGVFTECDDIVAFDELKYFTGLTEIEPEAFYGAYNLNKITLPKSIKSIGEYAFADCVGLIQLNINDGVKKIGYGAFEECRNLKSITIPGSVEEIQLTYEHYYDDGELDVEYGNPFTNCTSLEAIYSPYASDNRSIIMDNTLIYVASAGINEYTIPAKVKSIANNALGSSDYDVSLFSKVVISKDVEYIDYYGLLAAEYHFESMTPPYMHEKALGYWDNYDDNSKPIIYIPDGAYKAYYGSDWSKEYKDAIYHEKTKLATPVLTEIHTETSFTVAWEAVTNADSYMVYLDGENYNTAECSYTFDNLSAGNYKVRVKAKGLGHEDSDFATIVISLTGLTSVDWFDATAKPAESNMAEGYGPYNAIEFTWKGTGVKTLSYGLFDAKELLDVSNATIKDYYLTAVDDQIITKVNSADGFSGIFTGLEDGTTYTMCVFVANDENVECFTKVEIIIETLEASNAAKAWMGTWEVKSTQKYSINNEGEGTVIDESETFTVEISASTKDPNEVIIYGLSVLGFDWPTYGVVEEGKLYILNGTYLGEDSDGYRSYSYYWLGWYDFGLSIDAHPSSIVTMNGDSATSTNKFNIYDDNNNPRAVECYCSDVFGIDNNGNVYFFIDDFPAVYRTGDMTWTKTSATHSRLSRNFVKPSVLTSSVVVAM